MSDHIELIDNCYQKFGYIFWKQKGLIFAAMVIVTVFWGLCIYMHKATYQATVLIGPLRAANHSSFLPIVTKKDWDIKKLYALFSASIKSLSLREFFYQQGYLPYDFTLIERSTINNEQYYLTFFHDTSADAVRSLKQFIAIINKNANEQLALMIARQKIEKVLDHKRKIDSSNVKQVGLENIFMSSVIVAQQFSSMQQIDLFHYDSPIILSNTKLESKLSSTLILGVLGGLIIGFFIAALRISYAKKY